MPQQPRPTCPWVSPSSGVWTQSAAQSAAPRRRPGFSPAWRWLAAACLALCGIAGWSWQARRAFATVAREAGAVALARDERLRGAWHELTGGTVEIVTARGARLVIEAPAVFRFESAQRLHLRRGRLAADVPPAAKGFTVITPTGDAVDLGTRFGVDVPAEGAAEIHVFQGEVIAQSSGESRGQSVQGGDAVTMRQDATAARELRSAAFIQAEEVAGLTAGLAAGQRARAESALAKLRTDPTLIAVLDFESGEAGAGAFRLVQGRWPGSRAPEFLEAGDHLKLNVGRDGAWPRLTLAAWVRLDRLHAPYQSLLHTDGWTASNPGQVHWMVNRFSTVRLALRGNALAPGDTDPDSFPDSRTPVLPEMGRWMHLAVVYDADAKTVRFFLNGRFDREARQSVAHPARLGPAQIGNWARTDRLLSGRVDELVILGRAMDDAEVLALFEAGNPYR